MINITVEYITTAITIIITITITMNTTISFACLSESHVMSIIAILI